MTIQIGKQYSHKLGTVYTTVAFMQFKFDGQWVNAVQYQSSDGKLFGRTIADFLANFKEVT
jgi:hypothetical protein